MPKEKNLTRVILTQAEYDALLQASLSMDWRFRVALVIWCGRSCGCGRT